jgi:putative ABC transport system permease protein
MHLWEYLQGAWRDLVRQKMRTFLTMLGMIFGVGAVISMLSIGAGAEADALELIDSMGLRNIIVREKEVDDEDLYTMRERSLGLSLRDLDGVSRVVPDIAWSTVRKRIKADRVLSPDGRSEGQVLGVGTEYFRLLNLEIDRGASFDDEEELSYRRVAVLGYRAARDLFASVDPIGQPIKINGVWFTVIGTLQSQNLAKESFQGVEIDSGDTSVFVPITSALKMFDRGTLESELDELVLQMKPEASIEQASVLVFQTLRELHGGELDFTLVVPQELLAQSQRTRAIFNIVMGGIAGISLLVGGIGIMNIMLASVLQRTREIGVRRAVGARRRDILSQFLFEAVLISMIGGAIGVVMGLSIAWGVARFSDMNTLVSGLSIALSFMFSLAVGVVFGTYPARNAARLDPIDALRYE